MQKIKIGIPRALLYYKYGNLWTNFFQNLGCDVIISPVTNKEIIDQGNKLIVDEACLSLKIFMGHVWYLQDKCDYVFIPRIACVTKNEKLCTNFLAIYDLVKNTFPNLKILNFNYDKQLDQEQHDGYLKIGKQLDYSYLKSFASYTKALAKQQEKNKNKNEIILNNLKSSKLKIMLVAHCYNLYDEFIGKPIIKYLESQNVMPILADYDFQGKIDCHKISQNLYWTFNKELMTFIQKYKSFVDGIILISTFPCGPDSLANELVIRKVKDVPISYITIDNNASDTGLITRLESFIDIIQLQKEKEPVK